MQREPALVFSQAGEPAGGVICPSVPTTPNIQSPEAVIAWDMEVSDGACMGTTSAVAGVRVPNAIMETMAATSNLIIYLFKRPPWTGLEPPSRYI
jgi:hypothetical protein